MSISIPKDTVIETPRVVLRAPHRKDYPAWSDGRQADRAILEPWEPRWPVDALSREDWTRRLKAWRSAWEVDRAYVFLLFLKGTDDLAGGVSLTNVRRGPAMAASLGYWLLSRFQGHGLMQEAVSAISAWSRDTLGLSRLEAGTLPENLKSQAVLTRCQFVEEGRARAYLEIHGVRRDHILFGINLSDLAS
ncbi:MAG: GNAT family protein [Pseudomonadota bacterium]